MGAGYNRNNSSWFDLAMFEAWFEEILLPFMRKLDGPKIILGDNLSSHISLRVVQLFEEYDKKFVLLPPNSTLDVFFFVLSS